jgi:predicted DNA-binding protein (MmcQ/YjbR family)
MAKKNHDAILKQLRAHGMAYPGVSFKSPWPGHMDLAVKDKTFAYLSLEGEPLGVGCKLPRSSAMALMLPFCKPMAYGLGKSGWVSAKFPEGEKPPVDLLKAWIDESYRAQAPKKLVRQLDGGAPAAARVPAARSAKSARAARPAPKSPRKPSVSGTKKRARR